MSLQFIRRYDPGQPENLDLCAVTTTGVEVLILRDVTDAGCDWGEEQLALADGADVDQLRMLAADMRKRMPLKHSYTWRQMEAERLANLPLRRCNGQFKSQGAWS